MSQNTPHISIPSVPTAGYYVARFGAVAMDFILIGFLYYFISIAIGMSIRITAHSSPDDFRQVFLAFMKVVALSSVVSFGYFYLFEGLFSRTVGKMICQLKVVRPERRRCDFLASLVRNLIRPVDNFCFSLVGIICIFVTKKQQRVGDMAAKTQVVRAGSWRLSLFGGFLAVGISVGSLWGGYAFLVHYSKQGTGFSFSRTARAANDDERYERAPQNKPAKSLLLHNLRFTDGKNGPTLEPNYMPGEEVVFNFDLLQAPVDQNGNPDLKITFTAVDAQDRPLLIPPTINLKSVNIDQNGGIPVYYLLKLPSYLNGGVYRIQFDVYDRLTGLKADGESKFTIDGPQIPAGQPLGIGYFRYYDKNGDSVPTAVYSPGDTVHTKFNIIGLTLGPDNQVSVRLDMTVENARGKVLFDDPNTFEQHENLYYPPTYLSVQNDLEVPDDIKPGKYIQRFTIHDDVAGVKASFSTFFIIQ